MSGDDLEGMAVHRAALSGLRWNNLSEQEKEYYRRLVRDGLERKLAYEKHKDFANWTDIYGTVRRIELGMIEHDAREL
jgi:hypothetical protein